VDSVSNTQRISKLDRYQALLKDRLYLGAFATFVPNKQFPVYNWLYYKEGFSRQLVYYLLDSFSPKVVLDPFCGSGTTLLACKQRGINSFGVDSMPISVFASLVKTRDYDLSTIEEIRLSLLKSRFSRIDTRFPRFFHRYFSRYALEDISFFLHELNNIEEPYNSFFRLALINSAVKVSWAFKDGAVLKIRKHGTIPLRRMLARVTARMISDLRDFETKACTTTVKQGDARFLNLDNESVDTVITSPPYLNNIDYTKVYSIENWFVGEAEPPLRSFIGGSADAYFNDIGLAMKEMHRVCKTGSKAAVVVGNAYFDGKIVDSDLILSSIAEETGFSVKEILVLNKRYALERRTIKKGVLRESVILLEK
jgi:SAM-dependent methyltransferase